MNSDCILPSWAKEPQKLFSPNVLHKPFMRLPRLPKCIQIVNGIRLHLLSLKYNYKGVDQKKLGFSTLRAYPNSHWKLVSNRKKFLEELESKLGIQEPSDWGSISIQKFKNAGGASILSYYQNSLFKCLRSTYSGSKFFVYNV